MKKEINFAVSKGKPSEEESLAISHALAQIVNRTFAHEELTLSGSNWAIPEANFRKPPRVQPQGWQHNSP